MKLVARFMNDESGATAIEYGLIAALISVAIIGAATSLGDNISGTFGKINDELTGAGTEDAGDSGDTTGGDTTGG